MECRVVVWLLSLAGMAQSLNNGLARTPPMGWLSWERFRCVTDCKTYPDTCISENLYKAQADKLVELGLRDLGYVYVDIDDCWMAEERDSQDRLVPDPERFPSGIKALADYMHGKGLKLGIYEDFGSKTCGGYPGSEFYMQMDATTFAEWGVDMVKFDGCNSRAADDTYGYPVMGMYLNQTGRPILYSCEWPLYEYANHIKSNYSKIVETCNIWRNYDDVTDSWDSVLNIISHYANNNQNFSSFNAPGSFNDPDMLVVGDFGLSFYQAEAQFGMWAMLSAPLFMSNDLRNIDPQMLNILKNKDVIAINQDSLGIAATLVIGLPKSIMLWKKPLSNGAFAVALLNQNDQGTPTAFQFHFKDCGMTSPNGYNLTDVFKGTSLGQHPLNDTITVTVNPTSILLIKALPL